MTLPTFAEGNDPGPSFLDLLRRSRGQPWLATKPGRPLGIDRLSRLSAEELRSAFHGTTALAIRYRAGVVMAADRRAVSGTTIVLRTADKLFPVDQHTGVAVAGTAGPALEMVRLFRTEIEHYEKVEGVALTLEGKANRLSRMVRENLPAAMLGMAVLPLLAGYGPRRRPGRLFAYDLAGGRYEEAEFHAIGSGAAVAGMTVKVGYREGLERGEAVDLALEALYHAADEDTLTGGPDVIRGIYPSVATIDEAGFRFVDVAQLSQGLPGPGTMAENPA